jgi:general secretion pathway protein G
MSALPRFSARFFSQRAESASSPHQTTGFTVIEAMLVVAIVAILAAITLPLYGKYRDRIDTFQAVSDIGGLQALISAYELDHRGFPDSLADISRDGMRDPWGNPYQYLSHDDNKAKGRWRKDHNIVPINSDYDLWSNGKDGKSTAPLTAKVSRDDIVRASNGRFIGLASDFDP